MLVDIPAFVEAGEGVQDGDPSLLQLRHVAISEEGADIAVPSDQGGDHRGIVWDEAEEQLVQLGAAQPEVVVGHEAGEAARLPLFEYKRAAADGRSGTPLGGVDRTFGIEDWLQNVGGDDADPA